MDTRIPAVDDTQRLGAVDDALASDGHVVIGADEAGRGPAAGPLVAAAVTLPTNPPAGLDDSKKLSPARRATVAAELEVCATVTVRVVDADVVDMVGVGAANRAALRAVVADQSTGTIALVDGFDVGDVTVQAATVPTHKLVRGDQRSRAVAAASIVAKHVRDQLMDGYDRVFPGYGFAQHRGYLTAQHRDALAAYGPCPIHRRSWKPVADAVS